MPYFEHIPNLKFDIRVDFIGVTVLEEIFAVPDKTSLDIEELKIFWDHGSDAGFITSQFLYEAIEGIGDSRIELMSGHPGTTDTHPYVKLLFVINIALLALSIGVLVYVERDHIKLFMQDIGAMVAYGAEKKHLYSIFIAEFIVAAILSALAAFGLTLLSMYFIISHIQATVVGATWIVYTVNLSNILVYITAFFVLECIALILTLAAALKQSSVSLVSSVEGSVKHSNIKKAITGRDPVSVLVSIFSKRTRNIRGTLSISVSFTAAVIAAITFSGNIIYYEFSDTDRHLQIDKWTSRTEFEYISAEDYIMYEIELPGFSDEDAAYVRNIPYVVDCGIDERGGSATLWITVNDADNSGVVYKELLKSFGASRNYRVYDNVARRKADMDFQKGLYDLIMILFAVFFIVLLIVVFIRVTGYVEAQSENIYLLRLIGASGADIYDSFMNKAFFVATTGVILSFALGFGIFFILSLIALQSFGERAEIFLNVQTLVAMLSAVVLFYAAYLLPMYLSVKKRINSTLDELRGQSLCQ
ncbi:MAG: hypothetical protein LBH95_06100 [Oscillospiraceae bacterium]|nr:hypothetical protein [Oscillospiraceae bacterium]